MMILLKRYLCLLGIVIYLNVVAGAKDVPLPFTSVFPRGVKLGFVLRLGEQFPDIAAKKSLFDISHKGQPFLVIDDTFIGLKSTKKHKLGAFKIPELKNISDFTWMEDGTLLVISGKKLGEITIDGFQPIINLPFTGMKIKPASTDRCYLYDGNMSQKKQEIYLYKKGGELLKLFQAPGTINAIAGDGKTTFIAIGKEIFALRWNGLLTLIYEVDDNVTSLEFYPPVGLFYSTKKTVGYIHKNGEGYEFIRGQGGDIRVKGDDLYIFFQDSGDLLKCFPVSKFNKLTKALKKNIRDRSIKNENH